jgi:hypothetical protein
VSGRRPLVFVAIVTMLALVACRGPAVYPTVTPTRSTLLGSVPTPSQESGAVGTPVLEASQATPRGRAASGFAYGFNVAWRGDEDGAAFNQRTAEMVRQAGFQWVRFQVRWESLEPRPGEWDFRPIDRVLPVYEAAGLSVLASVVGAPEWARAANGGIVADPATFREAMRRLASRYRGRIHAWEIWNEQNLAHELHGPVRVEPYCAVLRAGYEGVKAGDPEALVVFGGLTPTGVNDPTIAMDDVAYLEAFYALDGGSCTQYFDVLGAHANATLNPPDTLWPERPGPGPGWRDHPSFYFRRVEQLRAVMERHGDRRPVWITEFGWTTNNPAPGYEYGQYVSEEQQAEYLVRAFEIARTRWPWVTGMFVWNLNFSTIVGPEDEKGPWSVLNPDWSPRPAYRALSAMPKQP